MAPAKKSPGTSMAKYDEVLAKMAKMGQKTVKAIAGAVGTFIGTSGGSFTIDGVTLKEKTMEVIIPDYILENDYYPNGYDKDTKVPPECFAFGREEEDMAPHADSSNPQGLAEQDATPGKNEERSCAGCWANQWESAPKGKGKACQNRVRLAIIPVEDIGSAEDVKAADVKFLKVPVTSGKAWAKHVNDVAEELSAPVLVVSTNIEIFSLDGGGHGLDFSAGEKVDQMEVVGALIEKHEAVAEIIDFPYTPASEQPEKPARRGPPQRSSAPAKSTRGSGFKTPTKAAATTGKPRPKY